MLLTLPRLKELIGILDVARRASVASGQGNWCDQPNTADGSDRQWVPKPRAKAPVGTQYADGTTLEEKDGVKGVWLGLGVHGRSALVIDPLTGEIRCGKCEGVV